MALPPDGTYEAGLGDATATIDIRDRRRATRPSRRPARARAAASCASAEVVAVDVSRMAGSIRTRPAQRRTDARAGRRRRRSPASSPSSSRSTASPTRARGSSGDSRPSAGDATVDPPDRGRPVPDQHERVDVDRGAARVHVRHGARRGPAPPPRVVRAARDRPPRPVVGPRRAHRRRSTRRSTASTTCAATARRRPRSRSGRRSNPMPRGPGDPLVDAEFCWPDLAAV